MNGAYITAVLFFNYHVSCCDPAQGYSRLSPRGTTEGDLLRGVVVPPFALAGGQATLGCSFQLSATRLYSLKWYHNNTEFYRFVPTERARAINIQPTPEFSVAEVFRSDQHVTLSLTRLTPAASGRYRCEVIAEHPSFRTEAASGTMAVLREPLSPPVVVGAREIYQTSEVIKIGCRPRHAAPPGHLSVLSWYLDGRKVLDEYLSPFNTTSQGVDLPGLSLRVPGQEVAAAGGTVQAECRLSLGPHSISTFKTLRVRVRMVSYVGPYQSAGTHIARDTRQVTAVLASVLLLLLLNQ
ncbi:uncharacterized protein LOC123514552 [Portunus trituberculatus]|uniref:uncharacterized protein LOC123514552 n=1 Tax=Portunus trituberculatus TaxID=210409 RepID=UPI001E1CE8D3|nr:uncharacterized protein LOC123514552 [Portunus trituberculatus]